MIVTTDRLDRACGVLLGTAAGDALGAGYEFGPPLPDDTPVHMRGGGGFGWVPGEWTDDTSMAVAIAEVAAEGVDLRSDAAQDRIVEAWVGWAHTAKDVGNQTRAILSRVGTGGAVAAREAGEALHRRTGHTAGNGSLMRTAPVALAHLDDEPGLIEAATALSSLTHVDPEAGEACVLWCLAIRHAVLTGELDVRRGLSRLPSDRADVWRERIELAERSRPADFARNGWVVEALQAAWCAIATTPVPADEPAVGRFRVDHLRLALEAAVRGGRDTDTVAAIAGGLLGAAYGASAVPARWRYLLHGWPGLRARHLVELGSAIVRQGQPDPFDFTYAAFGDPSARARHPHDEQVWLGGITSLRDLPPDVDAVVSLCRVGDADLPGVTAHLEVRLIDREGANPHLGFVLDDTVRAVQELRAAGRTVLIHCVQAHSRTPAVAALYGMRLRGITADEALADVQRVLPSARPNRDFREALRAADRTA